MNSDGSGAKPIPVAFELVNTGDEAVVILDVEKSCGCAEAVLQPSARLLARQRGQLLVRVEPPIIGERRIQLHIKTDSVSRPRG